MDASDIQSEPVRQRLLDAALACFLADEYHNVTTRMIAQKAGANVSMIRYYFGNKGGLYEEMIRETVKPLLDVLDGQLLETPGGFADYFRIYYTTMLSRPEFPKLILKVLALNQGPGRHFIQQLLERGRTQGTRRIDQMKSDQRIAQSVDADMLRLAFVSLAITPMLLKDIFEEQKGSPLDATFLEELATFNGRLFSAGLMPDAAEE